MIDKSYVDKYPKEIKMLKRLDMDDNTINSLFFKRELFTGWEPITLKELIEMDDKDHTNLLSVCWHDGEYRCHCIGVSDLVINERKSTVGLQGGGKKDITYWNVSFGDENGDPDFEVREIDEKIDNIGDGDWNYGLYKKIVWC